MPKKLFVKTHGCQMNEYDSAKMIDLLQAEEDFELVESEEQADLLILNTCSIREKAQERVFHQIGRWRKIKDKKPDLKIAIGGCVASQEGEKIIKRAPAVDIVFGPQSLHNLPKLYNDESKTKKSQIDISFPKLEKFDHIPMPERGEASSFVSIVEGCNKYCSFCVVPKTRGHEVSRSIEDILKEVSILADKGTKEIHFLGQNVNNFKGTYKGEKSSLAVLIELAAKIDNIERIRFTTSHPHEFKDDLVEAYARVPELVSHVHLPVQSGSDRILKLMRRRYTAEKYLILIDKLKKVRPDMRFSSDFIVGFPGETKQDFEETMNIINAVKFDESYSFIYSARPDTPAAIMVDDVSQEEKKERLNILQARLSQLAYGYSRKMVGSLQNCLVTGVSKKDPGQLQARTICDRVVNFRSDSIDLEGQLINIRIEDALPNCLRGSIEN
ncbi:MAG: tRNA (N6-isopentenyl adenosine(37)-C2)-methylthiotransferase MiaB [Gammaproteobacteria bacterium]|jgi:tRNA-2-methylthio-N6-dimethylallyladenosine synthase|nr:tRNA (N6-isopentenyl adenosine(37)-C2)-methylthiotransferase MiaB [Gammaproteobacteria bacterium]|tara:strand:- start:5262 stop:6587 length:1326 start_codon:yes stop_codon:yes gene_type:complete